MNVAARIENFAPVGPEALEASIQSAKRALLADGKADGHWCFELEADTTIPAEYVLMRHFRAEPVAEELERKIAVYLRRMQGGHGGWPLFQDGAFNISASVKAYFALKMIGDDVDAPHMVRAREAILAHGGAATSNVFTRALLALYGEIPWRGVPVMPVEIMLLPRWFPFHLDKISYWGRTVLVPLLVLMTKRPQARNPKGVRIQELFTTPPEEVKVWPKGEHQTWPWAHLFGEIDKLLRLVEPHMPKRSREYSVQLAERWTTERLNGVDGLGAIFPAMVNSLLMYDALGIAETDQRVKDARESIERLLVVGETEAYCQPCVSPVWDTSLVAHALLETGGEDARERARAACDWLAPLQVLDVKGDWAAQRPDLRPGGWAFQYANAYYPDVDDTAVVATAMDRLTSAEEKKPYAERIARAKEWIVGMQSKNGGWGAFDADNAYHYLNHIPFADHGALLDPPTVDVSARCVSMLAQLGDKVETSDCLKRGVDYIIREQEKDGSWFGRWGANYVYGAWSALCALNAAGLPHSHESYRRAVSWLVAIQNPDGGWGEDLSSYKMDYKGYEPAPSTSSQTAWAILGLMAAGEVDHPAVARGVAYLQATQAEHGLWDEPRFTATGFPRVFYLRYHGYRRFFPLWALARYRNLLQTNSKAVTVGL
ncbi:squalene--hopene cyclase [Methylocystis parvus]|uniref:Squalene--hopene cyclase n=1 Tax=Methylocystis parvus TaxID=134 RepID=A0A6B8MBC4_9HYPH|nr:squalene--hopene cyclase [Methylocystis parvus]QGM97950.1 squalene--hopene cyclase [Methylocystis parvus]WBK01737.1 squalene--hopene cyclase [Methylocystis parvus OBBP]